MGATLSNVHLQCKGLPDNSLGGTHWQKTLKDLLLIGNFLFSSQLISAFYQITIPFILKLFPLLDFNFFSFFQC
jgi:hypothetical protein